MTTARERMKQLSGLLGAHSARAHFLAITQGTGTGVDRLIFASQMTVCLDDPQIALIDRTPPRLSVVTPAIAQATQGKKRIDVVTRPARITVATAPSTLHIVQKTHRAQVVTTLPRLTVTRRPRITT